MPNKIVMGIDPGFGIMGWGVIKLTGEEVSLVDYGAIETDKEDEFGKRLCDINEKLEELYKYYHPDDIAIEELFFAANVTTALKVAGARGIALMRAYYAKIPVFNYKPNQVKIAITGGCKAKKKDIQLAVGKIFNQEQRIKPDDAADALGIALTHAFNLCANLSHGK